MFDSAASNLVAGDRNKAPDVFVHDRRTRQDERVSLSSRGGGGQGRQRRLRLFDERRRAFRRLPRVKRAESGASLIRNKCLTPSRGEPYNCGDVFVRDRETGTTLRVSVTSTGKEAKGESAQAMALSAAWFVSIAFASDAYRNLVRGDTNRCEQRGLILAAHGCIRARPSLRLDQARQRKQRRPPCKRRQS